MPKPSFIAKLLGIKASSPRSWNHAVMRSGSGKDGAAPPFSHELGVRSFSSWVYAAASINANAVAALPLRLYIRNGGSRTKLWRTRRVENERKAYLLGDGRMRPSVAVMRKAAEIGSDFEEVTDDHPLLRLLSVSNPWLNGFDATVLRVVWQELTGNAYLHVVTDPSMGVPSQLYPMPPQWTRIIPSEERFVDGYVYGRSRESEVRFTPEEVIHFKRPNPRDLLYGMGKLEAAWGVAAANTALHEMDLSTFKNQGRPDYLVSIKGAASEDDMAVFEEQLKDKLQGTRKSGSFLIANQEIDLKPLQFPPKDITGREAVVEEIAAVFGVPVSMLKANDPNLASAQTGFTSWREMTVLPLARMDEEILNQRLLPMFGLEGDAILAYDNPVPSNRQQDLAERQAAVSGGWMTANEARQEQGLDALPDPEADKLHVGGQPLGGQPAQPAQGTGGDALPALDGGAGQLPSPAPATPPSPTDAPQPAAGQPVANTALNGAQISSLVTLAAQAKSGELPLESARAIAAAAFPSIPQTVIDSIFSPIVPSSATPAPAAPAAVTPTKANDISMKADPLQECVSAKISKLIGEGYPHEQAIAIAFQMCQSGKAAPPCSCGSSVSIAAAAMEIKNCGTVAGGFQAGNECGGGDGGGSSDASSSSKKPSTTEGGWSGDDVDHALLKTDVGIMASALGTIDAPQEVKTKLAEAGAVITKQIDDAAKAANEGLPIADPVDALRPLAKALQDAERIGGAALKAKVDAAAQKVYTAIAKRAGCDLSATPDGVEMDAVDAAQVAYAAVASSHFFSRATGGNAVFVPSQRMWDEHFKQDGAAAYWRHSDGAIIFNPASGPSVDNMVHELAHAHHAAAPRGEHVWSRGFISQKVSLSADENAIAAAGGYRPYGRTNRLEFVAVTHEMLVKGTKLTPECWKLYDKFHGPNVPPAVRKSHTRPQPKKVAE